MKQEILTKLKSRKFWLTVAAFLASIATSITGLTTSNTTLAEAGIICGVLSTAIYAAAEAYVDASANNANTTITNTTTTKQVTASSTDKTLVQKVMNDNETAGA